MLLERLSELVAPSGYEDEVRNFIVNELNGKVDSLNSDKMGNVIANKNGKRKKIIISTHMDETGFIITGFNKEGTLRIASLGDENRDMVSKGVLVGTKKLLGVIGAKAIHLQTKEERSKSITLDRCCIDIGAETEFESREYIELGDFAVYDTRFQEMGTNRLKGKGFNGRVGCSMLIELLQESESNNIQGIFTTQSLVGYRGAYAAAYELEGDLLINLDVVESTDLPGVDDVNISIDKGPVLYLKEKNRDIRALAEKIGIPYQLINDKIYNDSNAYKMELMSTNVINILVPCRYVDSYASIISKKDYEDTKNLINSFLKEN
ncbi:peptidase M42 [Clostridium cellulovorans]|uniref:Peptidase M42 family protein n=2 Tax=Clostridium cellulovorans TaxID=1493 RepID=D9SMS4_CLOC7|nr:peptidase M42 [Clostridium cellulovorans]ADL49859.1 peptidase M42 family protein [Clostridium cellulovorans 743B]BAV13075.1 cellulase M [Clostridium cellulovorans]